MAENVLFALQQQSKQIERLERSLMLNKPILNLEEACIFTGLKRVTFYKYTSEGKIPHYKQARHLYFDREELISWLKENRGYNTQEIENDVRKAIISND